MTEKRLEERVLNQNLNLKVKNRNATNESHSYNSVFFSTEAQYSVCPESLCVGWNIYCAFHLSLD